MDRIFRSGGGKLSHGSSHSCGWCLVLNLKQFLHHQTESLTTHVTQGQAYSVRREAKSSTHTHTSRKL